MPVIGPSEQDRSAPYPLRDGLSPTIGWYLRDQGDSRATFVILCRRRLGGTLKVIESFPLTEDGWADAWQSLAKRNPEAIPKVLETLSYRQAHASRPSRNSRPANELDASAQATDHRATQVPRSYTPKEARKLRRELQKALKRPVILLEERRFDQAKRAVVDHRRAVIGLGVLGVSIASVATAGVASAILIITAASLPAVDFPTFFGAKALDPNQGIILEPDAVAELLDMPDVGQRAEVVLAAINKKRGTGPDVRMMLSGADITEARKPMPGRRIELGRAGIQMGFTVIVAGLLLLALSLIPHDIHRLMTRAASVILIVGVLLVGAALADGGWPKRR
jgi:hypothetical protein